MQPVIPFPCSQPPAIAPCHETSVHSTPTFLFLLRFILILSFLLRLGLLSGFLIKNREIVISACNFLTRFTKDYIGLSRNHGRLWEMNCLYWNSPWVFSVRQGKFLEITLN